MALHRTVRNIILTPIALVLALVPAALMLSTPALAYKCTGVNSDGTVHTYKDGSCYATNNQRQANEKAVHNDGTAITDWRCSSGTYDSTNNTCKTCTAFGQCQASTTVFPAPASQDTTTDPSTSNNSNNNSNSTSSNSTTNNSGPGSCAGTKTHYFSCSGNGIDAIASILQMAIIGISVGVGIVAIGGLTYAAILYASAQDNQDQVRKAISVVRSVVIGLVLYVFMAALVNFLVPGGIFTSSNNTNNNATCSNGSATSNTASNNSNSNSSTTGTGTNSNANANSTTNGTNGTTNNSNANNSTSSNNSNANSTANCASSNSSNSNSSTTGTGTNSNNTNSTNNSTNSGTNNTTNGTTNTGSTKQNSNSFFGL